MTRVTIVFDVHYFAHGSEDSACGEHERCRSLLKERTEDMEKVTCLACQRAVEQRATEGR